MTSKSDGKDTSSTHLFAEVRICPVHEEMNHKLTVFLKANILQCARAAVRTAVASLQVYMAGKRVSEAVSTCKLHDTHAHALKKTEREREVHSPQQCLVQSVHKEVEFAQFLQRQQRHLAQAVALKLHKQVE